MFGWELPPQNSGGLGVACLGLAKSLTKKGVEITFVLPRKVEENSFFRIVPAKTSYKKKIEVNSLLSPYLNVENYKGVLEREESNLYGKGLFDEVERYRECGRNIAEGEDFDVIHAHDWLSFGAGIEAKKVSGKPLVVHIHATEFDRGGGGLNEEVYKKEKEGFKEADKVVAVSNYTKSIVVHNYGIPEEKVEVVHNGADLSKKGSITSEEVHELKKKGKKMVLFVGRLTVQKGPDYFVRAAKKVCEVSDDVYFVVSGSGDMETLQRMYKEADLFVMPSVSEPFGLTPLESIVNGTPVMISKQSGVSELLFHSLQVDFWDVDEMASKILAVLSYGPLSPCLVENGKKEVEGITWDDAARKCIRIYNSI